MNVDCLVIGQGISGTWLSYYLQQQGRSFMVIDNNDSTASSRIAAGVINPVTGRRHVEVWMADEILPYAKEAYTGLAVQLNTTTLSQKNIIDFFPTPQMRVSFMQRVEEKTDYVFPESEPDQYRGQLNYDFGYGEIKPVYTAHLDKILPAWRSQITGKQFIREEAFAISQLRVEKEKIIYKDIEAARIIFCDGNTSASNPYFDLLPFAPNKGEALLVDIPELKADHIYKKGMMLVPYGEPGQWWIGSNYAWEFDNPDPTELFREKTTALLKDWIKVPFEITAHLAGVRPATLERRPFVGFHPVYPNVGILNGMGTKGCSLAPYFANQLVNHMYTGTAIHPEADIKRFQRILSRKTS